MKVFLAWFVLAVSLGRAQSLIIPQIADGGGWQTTLVLTNTTGSATSVSLSFFLDAGAGATQSWSPSFLEGNSTQNLPLGAGGTLFLHTPGTAGATAQGWAQVDASAAVVAYSIFTYRFPGRQDQDGTAGAASSSNRILMPFDNTNGLVTSMAIVNPTPASESISVGIQPSSGASWRPVPIDLPAQGHKPFTVPQQFPTTSGQSGLLEFYSASGSISILALRFNPTGAFTTAPVYSQLTGPPIIAGGNNVSGLWGGISTGGSVPGNTGLLILALSQTGPQLTGSFSYTGTNEVSSAGAVSGSVTANTFTLASPPFFDSRGCGAQLTNGTAQVTGITMQGAMLSVDSACGTELAGTFPIQFTLKAAVEKFCGTASSPGGSVAFLFLVSADGSVVGSGTPATGKTGSNLTGQVTGSSLALSDSEGNILNGTIQNGTVNGTITTGGTFSASATACP